MLANLHVPYLGETVIMVSLASGLIVAMVWTRHCEKRGRPNSTLYVGCALILAGTVWLFIVLAVASLFFVFAWLSGGRARASLVIVGITLVVVVVLVGRGRLRKKRLIRNLADACRAEGIPVDDLLAPARRHHLDLNIEEGDSEAMRKAKQELTSYQEAWGSRFMTLCVVISVGFLSVALCSLLCTF